MHGSCINSYIMTIIIMIWPVYQITVPNCMLGFLAESHKICGRVDVNIMVNTCKETDTKDVL